MITEICFRFGRGQGYALQFLWEISGRGRFLMCHGLWNERHLFRLIDLFCDREDNGAFKRARQGWQTTIHWWSTRGHRGRNRTYFCNDLEWLNLRAEKLAGKLSKEENGWATWTRLIPEGEGGKDDVVEAQ